MPIETAILFVLQRLMFWMRAQRPEPLRDANSGPDAQLAGEWERRLWDDGYVAVPGFKSAAWCAQARQELLSLLDDPVVVTRHAEDLRVFGIETLCPTAREFAADPLLARLACTYARSREGLLFCMANKVSYQEGVPHGSGGEWHRDSFKRELKAMLYLTDVEQPDGPLSIVRGSHRGIGIVADAGRLVGRRGRLPAVSATRLQDAGDYFRKRCPNRVVDLTGESGMLLLFDASAIHTGLPPRSNGKPRLALTNYYSTQSELESFRAYYRPLVKLNGYPDGPASPNG